MILCCYNNNICLSQVRGKHLIGGQKCHIQSRHLAGCATSHNSQNNNPSIQPISTVLFFPLSPRFIAVFKIIAPCSTGEAVTFFGNSIYYLMLLPVLLSVAISIHFTSMLVSLLPQFLGTQNYQNQI